MNFLLRPAVAEVFLYFYLSQTLCATATSLWTHIFLLQVEQVVDGVVDSLREACHRHFVGLVGAWLREPDIHLDDR